MWSIWSNGFGIESCCGSGFNSGAGAALLKELRNQFGAMFHRAFLRFIVDMKHAETPLITEGPFEVVHQRPDEISAHVHAGFDGAIDGSKMALEEGDALLIVDAAVDHFVIRRHAVLGGIERGGRKNRCFFTWL